MTELSPEAKARRARGSTPEPPMPAIDDLAAVVEWRASLHAAWGEVHEARAPHEQHNMAMVGGVRCIHYAISTPPNVC